VRSRRSGGVSALLADCSPWERADSSRDVVVHSRRGGASELNRHRNSELSITYVREPDASSAPSRRQTMSDNIMAFQAIVVVCTTAAFVSSLRFLRHYLELRHQRRIPPAVDGLAERLERIELTVEATAVEVERISEANRFMSK